MIAIGCLAPLILAVIGGLAGNALAGPDMAVWGAGGGFALGGAVLGLTLWMVGKMKS